MKTSYLVPAILLNPILFLHSVNTLLAQIFPTPLSTSSGAEPFSLDALSHWQEHKIDIHARDNLCWSYTMVMVFAQCWAFCKVSFAREKRDMRMEIETSLQKGRIDAIKRGANGEANGHSKY
jgi:hypothetical protein